MGDEINLDAYFERIGFSGSIAPNLVTLEILCGLHAAAIPFENLEPLMGLPVRLQLSDVEQKLVFERRGGYCFEQNLLFKAVLDTLGFVAKPFAARVLWGHQSNDEPPLSHVGLAVDVDGALYLADVGFGALTPTAPLRLRVDLVQDTANETYRLTGGTPEWQLAADVSGQWMALYRFDLSDRSEDEFRQMNDLTSQSFAGRLVAARSEPGKRFALRNNRLNIHNKGGETETRMVGSTIELRDILSQVFGILLPHGDKLDPALEIALRPEGPA